MRSEEERKEMGERRTGLCIWGAMQGKLRDMRSTLKEFVGFHLSWGVLKWKMSHGV